MGGTARANPLPHSLIIITIIMNKLQETTVFHGRQIDFRYETKARKVIVYFKFDALYR